jgi:hypothetical protein
LDLDHRVKDGMEKALARLLIYYSRVVEGAPHKWMGSASKPFGIIFIKRLPLKTETPLNNK